MSKREKKRTKAWTIEYETPEGHRLTIIKDEERTETYVDMNTIPSDTLSEFQNIASGVLKDAIDEDVPPDTIDVYGKLPYVPVRKCLRCGAMIYRQSARFCPNCGEKLG